MSDIKFHTQDNLGRPIAALIRGINPTYGDWAGETDINGNFEAMLAPDAYTGVISAPGFVTRTIPWVFGADGSVIIGLDPQDHPTPPPTPADEIDLSIVQIVNAPNVAHWKQTARITEIIFNGINTSILFTKQDGPDRWPDVRPEGWSGNLQYTTWLFRWLNRNQWAASAFVQMWYGREGSGDAANPDVPSLYDRNYYYASRWAPLYGSGPIAPGEVIGMMVTSGNQRDGAGPNSVMERSNTVTFKATDNGRYTW